MRGGGAGLRRDLGTENGEPVVALAVVNVLA